MQAFSDDELRRTVHRASGVIVNDFEAQMLAGRLGMTEAEFAKSIPLLIITRGEKGCSLYDNGERTDIAACTPEKVLNPTGAGDAFRAGFLTGLTSGWTLLKSCQLGAALGSFVVEIEGTLLEDVDKEEVMARMEGAYGGLGIGY